MARAHFQQGGVEERHPGQQFARQGAQVQRQIEIHDAVGEEIVGQQGNAVQTFLLNGDDAAAGFQVLQAQQGDGGQRLGRVGRLLGAAQSLRFRLQVLHRVRVQGVAGRLQTRPLGREALVLGFGVGLQQHADAVRVFQQPLANQPFKPGLAAGDAALEGGQRRFEGQRRQRVAVMQPAAHGAQHQGQTAREAAGIVLAQAKLDGVDGRLDHFGLDAPRRQGLQGVQNQALDGAGVGHVDALHPRGEGHLPQMAARPARDVLAEAGIDERHPQRRGGRAQQDVIEDAETQRHFGVAELVQHPVERHQPLLLLLVACDGVAHADAARFRPALLQGHGRRDLFGAEFADEVVDQAQSLLRLVVAVKPDARVARVVAGLVILAELFPGQVGDALRVAAGIVAVDGIREQGLLRFAAQQAVRRGPGALHFVEDHALVDQIAVLVGFVAPAFLGQHARRQTRVKHGVEVDVDQVVEVLQILAGDGVGGLVGVGHGVEEGVERAARQLDEGVLDRVLARAAEYGMLKDVRQAGRIGRRRGEGDAEDLVAVVVLERDELRAGAPVAKDARATVDLGDVLRAQGLKAVKQGHGYS